MTDAEESSNSIQCVTFTLDGETYGIDVMQVKEVLRVVEIAPVPGAPNYVLGIISLRGNVVSVIDARSRFGLPVREHDDFTRIIIIEVKQEIIGILVDSVAEVIGIQIDEIDSAPSVGNAETSKYIDGVVSHGNKLLIVVDLNNLLSEQEWGQIKTM